MPGPFLPNAAEFVGWRESSYSGNEAGTSGWTSFITSLREDPPPSKA